MLVIVTVPAKSGALLSHWSTARTVALKAVPTVAMLVTVMKSRFSAAPRTFTTGCFLGPRGANGTFFGAPALRVCVRKTKPSAEISGAAARW